MAGWRNWQTQTAQNRPTARSWGFKSLARYHHQGGSARTDSVPFALASEPKSLRVTMIPLRRRGWHHPAKGKFRVPGKSGTPAPAPAAKDGTILNPSVSSGRYGSFPSLTCFKFRFVRRPLLRSTDERSPYSGCSENQKSAPLDERAFWVGKTSQKLLRCAGRVLNGMVMKGGTRPPRWPRMGLIRIGRKGERDGDNRGQQ